MLNKFLYLAKIKYKIYIFFKWCQYIILGLYNRLKQFTFTQIKRIPKFKKQIEEETKKISNMFENGVIENTKNEKYIVEIPPQGIPRDELLKTVIRYLNLGKLHICTLKKPIIKVYVVI